MHWLRGTRFAGTFGIAVYHRISPLISGVPQPTMNVTPDRFRQQLLGLRARGFSAWPLARLLACHAENIPVPQKVFTITFDDGFGSVYEHAWPVLRELDVPATVFVNTAYLDSDRPFPFDTWAQTHEFTAPAHAWRPLRVAECEAMFASGLVEIGSHTHTHADFRGRPQQLAADLALANHALQTRLGITSAPFAFPYGRVKWGFASPELGQVVQAAGLQCALTTEALPVHPAESPFHWGRFNAYQWDTAATLAAKFAGWYSWGPALQERWLKRSVADSVTAGKEVVACPK